MSALLCITDSTRTSRHVRKVPILLQKSATTTADSVEDEAVDAVVCDLLHRKRKIASDAPGLHGTYAKALLCSRRRSHEKLGEPPEVLSDSSERELELGAPWPT